MSPRAPLSKEMQGGGRMPGPLSRDWSNMGLHEQHRAPIPHSTAPPILTRLRPHPCCLQHSPALPHSPQPATPLRRSALTTGIEWLHIEPPSLSLLSYSAHGAVILTAACEQGPL